MAANPLKKPFLPAPSAVPMLDPSVGNPRAFKDPNSAASMSLDIQALSDQVQADTLYDKQAPAREGFMGYQEAYSAKVVDENGVDFQDSMPAPYKHVPSQATTVGTGYRFELPNCQYANPNSVAAEHCGLGLPGPFSWINQKCAKNKYKADKQIKKDIQILEGFQGGMLSTVEPTTVVYALAAAGAGLLLCSFIHKSK